MFYHSCTPNDWRIMIVITLGIMTCNFTEDKPDFLECTMESPIESGMPTKAKLVEHAVGMIKALKTMKFDKLKGGFTENLPYFVPELSSAEECCVCMEKTTVKTNCGHTLCAECWHNLKEETCPICRHANIHICVCKDKDECDSPE